MPEKRNGGQSKTSKVKSNQVVSDGNSEVYVKTINSALLEHPQIGEANCTAGVS